MKKAKYITTFFLIFITLVVFSVGIFESPQNQDIKNNKVALVLEDKDVMKNEQIYNFGNQTIEEFPAEELNITTEITTRVSAVNGVNENNYKLAIIIPQDFTQNILSYDSKYPTSGEIEYYVNPLATQMETLELNNLINQIKLVLNKRMINVFTKNVMGTIDRIKEDTTIMVENETEYSEKFNQKVTVPFSESVEELNAALKEIIEQEKLLENFDQSVKNFERNVENANKNEENHLENFKKLLEQYEKTQKNFKDFDQKIIEFITKIQQENSLQVANELINDDNLSIIDPINQLKYATIKLEFENLKLEKFKVISEDIIKSYQKILDPTIDNGIDQSSPIYLAQKERIEEIANKIIDNFETENITIENYNNQSFDLSEAAIKHKCSQIIQKPSIFNNLIQGSNQQMVSQVQKLCQKIAPNNKSFASSGLASSLIEIVYNYQNELTIETDEDTILVNQTNQLPGYDLFINDVPIDICPTLSFDLLNNECSQINQKKSAQNKQVQKATNNLTINPITIKDTTISGTGIPGSAIETSINDEVIKTVVTSTGTWTLDVANLSEGQIIVINQLDEFNQVQQIKTIVNVLDVPIIEQVYDGDDKISVQKTLNTDLKITIERDGQIIKQEIITDPSDSFIYQLNDLDLEINDQIKVSQLDAIFESNPQIVDVKQLTVPTITSSELGLKTITGNGLNQKQVEISINDQNVGITSVDSFGEWVYETDQPLQVGDKITIMTINNNRSSRINTYIVGAEKLLNIEPTYYANNQVNISGYAAANYYVAMQIYDLNNDLIYEETVQANNEGEWVIDLNPEISSQINDQSQINFATMQDLNDPKIFNINSTPIFLEMPILNEVETNSTVVSGKAQPNTIVQIIINDQINEIKVDQNGDFSYDFYPNFKLTAGVVINAKAKVNQVISNATSLLVGQNDKPMITNVDRSNQTIISGTGTPGATVTVYSGTNQILETIVLSNGKWSVVQPAESPLVKNQIIKARQGTSELTEFTVGGVKRVVKLTNRYVKTENMLIDGINNIEDTKQISGYKITAPNGEMILEQSESTIKGQINLLNSDKSKTYSLLEVEQLIKETSEIEGLLKNYYGEFNTSTASVLNNLKDLSDLSQVRKIMDQELNDQIGNPGLLANFNPIDKESIKLAIKKEIAKEKIIDYSKFSEQISSTIEQLKVLTSNAATKENLEEVFANEQATFEQILEIYGKDTNPSGIYPAQIEQLSINNEQRNEIVKAITNLNKSIKEWKESTNEIQKESNELVKSHENENRFVVQLNNEQLRLITTMKELAEEITSQQEETSNILKDSEELKQFINETQGKLDNYLNNLADVKVDFEDKLAENTEKQNQFIDEYKNAKLAGAQNQDFYDNYVDPVKFKASTKLDPSNSTIPFLLIMLLAIFSLIIGYFNKQWSISSNKKQLFEEKSRFTGLHIRILITTGMGLLASMLVAFIGDQILEITGYSRAINWYLLVISLGIAMSILFYLLLLRLESIGMIIIATLILAYFITNSAIGQSFTNNTIINGLKTINPLAYFEKPLQLIIYNQTVQIWPYILLGLGIALCSIIIIYLTQPKKPKIAN